MTAQTPLASDESDAQLRAELDERYGRTRRVPRWVWGVVGAVGAAGALWLGWTMLAPNFDAVDADTLGYTVVDAHTTTVDFQATLRAGAPLTCVLEAQDEEHGIVGWKVVEYPADDAHARRFTVTIPTVAEATTGLVTSCWIP